MPVKLRRKELEPLRHPLACYGAAILVLILVSVVSLMPVAQLGGSDKLMHFVTYAGLGAGFAVLINRFHSLLVAAAALILYGVLLEILQELTGYRTMDSADMLANAAGVVVGILVWFTSLPAWFRSVEGKIA